MTIATLIALAVAAVIAGEGPGEGDSIEVKVHGTLRTGIMAIGGETTGTTITSRGVTWELDFTRVPALVARAESLDGRKVVVTGTLDVRPGVEMPQRTIVMVKTLEAPKASRK